MIKICNPNAWPWVQMVAYHGDPDHNEDFIKSVADANTVWMHHPGPVNHREFALHSFGWWAVPPQELPKMCRHLNVLGIIWQGQEHRLVLTNATDDRLNYGNRKNINILKFNLMMYEMCLGCLWWLLVFQHPHIQTSKSYRHWSSWVQARILLSCHWEQSAAPAVAPPHRHPTPSREPPEGWNVRLF